MLFANSIENLDIQYAIRLNATHINESIQNRKYKIMQVAIIGAGFVGESLARALINAGHEVMLSSRTPESDTMQTLIAELGDAAQAGTVEETLAYSQCVVMALSGEAIQQTADNYDWSGKIMLDLTQDNSETLAKLSGARVVKIFNTIGAEHYQDPDFDGLTASMLYCGDDAEAKQIAHQLASDMGFDAVDVGGLSMQQHLVNLAFLWINMMRNHSERNFAFKVIRK